MYNDTDLPLAIRMGTIRMSYTKNPTTGALKIIEENHNYPFGLKHNYNNTDYEFSVSGSNVVLTQISENKYNYQYNGKEWQDEMGLNMTTMEFRQYDNSLGRFVGIDRLSELAYSITPYRFAFNNPVFFGDPTGLIEMSMLRDMFEKSESGETWYNDNNGGFYSDSGGSVDYNGSNFTAPNYSGDLEHLPNVYVKAFNQDSYRQAANQIENNIYQTKWYKGLNDWDYASTYTGFGSGGASIKTAYWYNESLLTKQTTWTGKNGNYYQLSKVKNNGVYTRSLNIAKNSSKLLRTTGVGINLGKYVYIQYICRYCSCQ